MPSYISFTSLTWPKDAWSTYHYLCTKDKAEREFNGYYFTSKKENRSVMDLGTASKTAMQISTEAIAHVI